MKKTILLMLALIFTISLIADIAIGEGIETNKGLPIEPFYGYSYSQIIYLQSEINTAGDITTLTFDFAGETLQDSHEWVIYMGHTDKTQFDTEADWIDITTLTEVFNGSIPDINAEGPLTIDITDFAFNNTANLVISVDENTVSYDTAGDDFNCTTTEVARSLEYHSDGTNPDPTALEATPGNLQSVIANVILGGIELIGFPSEPFNPVPADLTGDMALTGDLTWDLAADVLTYDVKFGPAGNMIEVVTDAVAASTGLYSYTGLEEGTSYQWQIVVHNDTRETVEGPVWSFVTSYAAATLPLVDDFETDLGHFANAVSNNYDWVLVDTLASTGTKAVINAYGNYNNNILAVTSTLNLTTLTEPVLMFDQIAKTEGEWDHAYVEISVDGGVNWDQLTIEDYAGTGIYAEPTYNNPEGPCFNEDSYEIWGTSDIALTNEMFISERFNLDAYATATSAMIRFRLNSDISGERKGWVLDNLYIGEVPPYGFINGTVTLSGAGNVEDVLVTVGDTTVNPDSDGTFSVEHYVGTYDVSAELLNYFSFTQADVAVTDGEITVVDISLAIIPTGTVSGTATITDGAAVVTDVVITVGDETTNPATDGTFSVDLFPGTYTFNAILAGYTSFSQEVVIVSSETVTADFALSYISEDLNVPGNLSADEVTGDLTWNAPIFDLEEGFEIWPPAGWIFTDADGDGFQWNDGATIGLDAHTGVGIAFSASYTNDAGALTPDNWIISPAVNVGVNANVNYWVAAQDNAWAGEHYGVYVSTTGTEIADFELVFEETMVGRNGSKTGAKTVEPRGTRDQGTWYENNIDLSAYTGTIYVAFRHFNSTDMFYLDLDDVTISSDAARDLTREFIGYEVFLDGASVANVTETNHTLVGLVDGTTYEAGVTAVYDDGSSEMITITFTYAPTSGEENNVTAVTALGRNYPNPFNPTTNISFSLKEAGNVRLEVYNAKGQMIKTLVNGEMAADNHVVTWNGDDNNGNKVSSGIYFYKMHSKKYTETKKMLMIK